MSTVVSSTPLPPAPVPAQALARRRRWTCDEFHQLGDMGWFEGEKLILIEGEILEIPPPNPPHEAVTGLIDDLLRRVFGPGFWVRVQMAMKLGQSTDPVPDIAVVPGVPRDYLRRHPTTALIIVEVSDTTLAYNISDKASSYAAGGVADYWVIDLVNSRLIVFRDPQPDPAQPFGARYANVQSFDPSATASPLALPGASIRVADLLP